MRSRQLPWLILVAGLLTASESDLSAQCEVSLGPPVSIPEGNVGFLVTNGSHLLASYTSIEDAGFIVFDLADPASPRRVSSYSIGAGTSVTGLAMTGEMVVILGITWDSYCGLLEVVDLSAPIWPERLGRWSTPTGPCYGAFSLAVYGTTAYVEREGEWTDSVLAFNLQNPENPEPIHLFWTLNGKLAASHDWLFVADRKFTAYDRVRPMSPQAQWSNPEAMAYAVGAQERTVLTLAVPIGTSAGGKLHLYHTNDYGPNSVGTLRIPALQSSRIAIGSPFAYVAAFDYGLFVVDISAWRILEVARLLGDRASDVATADGLTWVAVNGRIRQLHIEGCEISSSCPNSDSIILPVVADAVGQDGERYSTELVVAALSDIRDDSTVRLEYFERGRGSLPPFEIELTIPEGEVLRVPEAIRTLFDREGSVGWIRFCGDSRLSIWGRLSTSASCGELGADVPAIRSDDLIDLAGEQRLTWLEQGGSRRSNLTLVNTENAEVRVEILYFEEDGEPIGQTEYLLPPRESVLIANALEEVSSAPIARASALVRSKTPLARVIAMASTMDSNSGDLRIELARPAFQ